MPVAGACQSSIDPAADAPLLTSSACCRRLLSGWLCRRRQVTNPLHARRRAMGQAGVVPTGSRFEWGWPGVTLDLDRVTWWVARSAAELLTSRNLTFVRECASYDCGWLFMDTTKNRSRRWCDMRTCGNRAKSRRHYERRRAADGAGRPAD